MRAWTYSMRLQETSFRSSLSNPICPRDGFPFQLGTHRSRESETNRVPWLARSLPSIVPLFDSSCIDKSRLPREFLIHELIGPDALSDGARDKLLRGASAFIASS